MNKKKFFFSKIINHKSNIQKMSNFLNLQKLIPATKILPSKVKNVFARLFIN